MTGRTIAFAVLLVLAIATSIGAWLLRPQPAPDSFIGPLRSDYSLRDYTLVALDREGRESFTVRGPQLAHDPNTGTLALDKPLFQFPQAGAARRADAAMWETRSEDGWVGPRGEEVRLSRGVVVQGPPAADGTRTRLVSDRMTIKPKTNRAYTDADVTITDRSSILRGRGMALDMTSRRYQLLSAVRGHHVRIQP